jgi:hypothetical protein
LAAGTLAGFGSIGSVVAVANIAGAVASKVGSEIYYGATVAASLAVAKEQDEEAQRALSNAVAEAMEGSATYDPTAISNALFGVFRGPVMACSDASTAIRLMGTAVNDMIATLPTTKSRQDISRAQSSEVSMMAALGAACLSTTIGGLQTRRQAVEAARSLVSLFQTITSSLDAVYTLFQANFRPDHRYYAQTETYETALSLVSSCIEYLIKQSFDLRIEKRYTLDREKTVIQICVEEYGLSAEQEIDNFIEWNCLEGDDVLILAQGREVVVYVEPKK